jgi:hypothetical protein
MATATTTTVTVNAAFFQEIKEVNQELWQLLRSIRDTCREPFEIASRLDWLVEQLEVLRDQLALHFALEEAYGYFEEPLVASPRLSQRAEVLRSEHRDLYLLACQLVDFVGARTVHPRMQEFAGQVAARFESFYNQLMAHESREEELILQAYDDDIGVGD